MCVTAVCTGDYGTTVGSSAVYRVILLQSVSMRYVQGHYNATVCIMALVMVSFLYCSLRQCGIYRSIILLQSMSVRYIQGHYCTAVLVITVYILTLLYCSLRQ